jgi:hypothetical protein
VEGLVARGDDHADQGPGVTEGWNDMKCSTHSGDSSAPLNDMNEEKEECNEQEYRETIHGYLDVSVEGTVSG